MVSAIMPSPIAASHLSWLSAARGRNVSSRTSVHFAAAHGVRGRRNAMARHVNGIGRRLVVGALAGAAGTAAMDLALYVRYRREGGKDPAWRWESAAGVKDWKEAPAPGQLGRKVERFVTRERPPDSWARPTTNLV